MQSNLRLLIFGASRQASISLNCKTIDLDQARINQTCGATPSFNWAHFNRTELDRLKLGLKRWGYCLNQRMGRAW